MSDGTTEHRSVVTPRLVIGIILLAVVVAIILDNTDDVPIGYVFGDTELPLILVLLGVLAVGGFVGYVLGLRHDRD